MTRPRRFAARLARSVRLARRAAYVAFAAWFAWYAYTRITTPPAVHTRPAEPTSATDRDALAVAVVAFRLHADGGAVPALTAVPGAAVGSAGLLAAAAAWKWSDVLIGFPAAVESLTTPRTNELLDRIVRLCDERLSEAGPTRWHVPLDASGDPLDCYAYDSAIVWLALRARWRFANGDSEGAVQDLRAGMVLGELADIAVGLQPPGARVLQMPNVVPLYEVTCTSVETAIPPRHSRELIRFLRDDVGLVLSEALSRRMAQTHAAILLDRYYTDDGRGNGWLVLSAAGDRPWTAYGRAPGPHNRLWNLASCFFYDRRTVASRLAGFRMVNRDLDEQSSWDNLQRLHWPSRAAIAPLGASILDGPFAPMIKPLDYSSVLNAMIVVARRRAAVVMLALNAHVVETGRFPQRLDELVPRYLDSIPLDASKNEEYTRQPDGTFDLRPRTPPPSGLGPPWWYPIRFPSPSYVPQREAERLRADE